MSAPLHYSGTAAVAGSIIQNNFNTFKQGQPSVNTEGFHHQAQNCCHLKQNHYDCYQFLEHFPEIEEIGSNQQQRHRQQWGSEEVMPDQLAIAMSSSMDETVNSIKLMELATPIDDIHLHENKLESTEEEVQVYLVETQTDWRRGISDNEGRFGSSGAANLEYQNYQLQLQNKQQISDNHANNEPDDQHKGQSWGKSLQMDVATSLTEEQHMEESNHCTHNTTINTNNINGNIEQEIVKMPSEKLYNTLKEYNALQDKYHTVLLLPKESKVNKFRYKCKLFKLIFLTLFFRSLFIFVNVAGGNCWWTKWFRLHFAMP